MKRLTYTARPGRGGRRKRRRRACPVPAARPVSYTDWLVEEYGPVLAIEYDDMASRRPILVYFADFTAYCEHSRACGTLYIERPAELERPDYLGLIGAGHFLPLYDRSWPRELWMHRSVRPTTDPKNGSRPEVLSHDQLRKMGYLLIRRYPGNPLDHSMECDPIFCTICHDYYPDNESPCRHVWWSGSYYEYVGPGTEYPEVSPDEFSYYFKAEVREAGCCEVLLQALLAGEYPRGGGFVRVNGRLEHVALVCSDAARWIDALGPDTPEATEMTITWLREVL